MTKGRLLINQHACHIFPTSICLDAQVKTACKSTDESGVNYLYCTDTVSNTVRVLH
jgi:hypothetical protein